MDKIRGIMRNKLFIRGLPWIVLTTVGMFILKEMVDIRLQYSKITPTGMSGYRDIQNQFGRATTLEDEYEKMKEKLRNDNWENKRVPRPDEPLTS